MCSLGSGGATILTGGQPVDCVGAYFWPAIIGCTHAPDAPCLTQEFFGPVLSVLGFDTEAEALALANDTEFGPASGVFTKDLARAHRMIRGIRAGIVWVNTYRAISYLSPFGGYKMSGLGRENGIEGMKEYLQTKSVWISTAADVPNPFVMR